jgi:uroporphyrinogen decarboxylase
MEGNMKIERPFKQGADFEHLRKVLMRETKEGPVPIIELFADPEVMSEVTGIDFPPEMAEKIVHAGEELTPEQIEIGIRLMDLSIAFSVAVGYDYVTMMPIVPLPRPGQYLAKDPVTQREVRTRTWHDEHSGLITSREDFNAYQWPSVNSINLLPLDYVHSVMPPGMKVLEMCMGIFEDLRMLMGFETLAIKSIEEPDLVDDILERLTEIAVAYADGAAAHPATGALFYAEDMGFNSGTMLSPAFMRKHIFPRQKRIAGACRRHGKPFLLHACGRMGAIMEDLIETVGIDGRHSFQDNVEPVDEVYRQYHDRISILGGLDMDLLARGSVEEVHARTRRILEVCAPGGGFCMGAGNSVANFVKIENYYAMLDETRKWNEEHA